MDMGMFSKVPRRLLASIICGIIAVIFMWLSLRIHRVFRIGCFLFAVYAVVCVVSLAMAYLGREIKLVSVILKVIVITYTLVCVYAICPILNHDLRMRRAIESSGLQCVLNIKELFVDYGVDNDRMPDADNWCEQLTKNTEKVPARMFTIRQYGNIDCSFAFNKNLSNQPLDSLQGSIVLLFETDGDLNLNGDDDLTKKKQTKDEYFLRRRMSTLSFVSSMGQLASTVSPITIYLCMIPRQKNSAHTIR